MFALYLKMLYGTLEDSLKNVPDTVGSECIASTELVSYGK